jgi:hypothetical protein
MPTPLSVPSRNDWREGIKGRGIKEVKMHPHPGPLPSRERGNWVEAMSIFWE